MPIVAAAAAVVVGYYAGAQLLVTLAINYALSRYSQKLAAQKARDQARKQPRNVTVQGTVEPRAIIYGQIRTTGVLLFEGLSGASNEFLWLVVGLATHQCEEISDIWLDNRKINNSDIDGTGLVVSGTFANRVRIKKHLGTDAQAADTDLDSSFTEWTSNHRLRGCAYIIVKMQRDDAVFTTGAPQLIQALVKGKRVYDPRKDSTNGGSGSHRFTNPTTWEWSNNWALCVSDYLTGGSMVFDLTSVFNPLGRNVGTSRIDWAFIATQANKSDEDVLIPPASPTTTQKRYTCDIDLSTTFTHSDNMEDLLACGAGSLAYTGGKYRLYAGAYDAPVHTITDDDVVGPIESMTSTPRKDRYNAVMATYWDENRLDQKTTSKGRYDSSYETEDGGRVLRTIDLDGVRNEYRAQRICELLKRKSRDHDTYSLPLGWNGFKIALWETANLQISEWWGGSRVARCIQWTLKNTAEGVIIQTSWKEESSSAYTDPLVSDYSTLPTTSSAGSQLEAPDAPTSLSAVGVSNAIKFAWNLPTTKTYGMVVELWEYTASTPFANATKIWEGYADHITIPAPASDTSPTTRYYWVRSRSPDAGVSATEPASTGLSAAPSAIIPSDADNTFKQRPIPDQEFSLSTAQDYWYWGSATGVSISLTGGVTAGRLILVGDGTLKSVYSTRAPQYPAVTTQQFAVYVRWRRTNTLTFTSAGADSFAVVAITADAIPPGTSSGSGFNILSGTAVNAVNVSEWQEFRFVATIANLPKNQPQLPYVSFRVDMLANVLTGTIEVDAVAAVPI